MITLRVVSKRRGSAEIRELIARAQDVTPVWPLFGNYLSREVTQQFRTQGVRFLGRPWKPLTPKYAASKRKRMGDPRILILDGNMRRSFTRRPMSIEIYGPKDAIYGSANRLAVFHQYGTRRNGKRVNPPRPILKETKGHQRRLKVLLRAHLRAEGNL